MCPGFVCPKCMCPRGVSLRVVFEGECSMVVVQRGCVSERVSVPGVACPGVMSEGVCVMSEGLCVQRACV